MSATKTSVLKQEGTHPTKKDIKIQLPPEEKPELINLESGEEMEIEELEEFSDLEEFDDEVHGKSVVSTETEKRGAAFRQKVEKFLVENRGSIPVVERGALEDEEAKNGKLMAELRNIRLNEQYTEEVEHFILMFNKKP